MSAVIRANLDESGMILRQNEDAPHVDEETILQCYVSIVTGVCIALGLR